MLDPSKPSRSSAPNGQIPNRSPLGQGMCQKVTTVARGSCSRTIRGTSAKW